MAISLYSATVPSYLQILGALAGLLDKAEAFCAETGLAPAELIGTRLAEDMLPFGYQVKAAAMHSRGAVEGVRKGLFSPDMSPWPDSFESLKQLVAETRQMLEAVDAQEIDALQGRDMRFEIGERRMDFSAEDFLLSFSLPNFYFHATTAYDILRAKGLQIGKRDFIGRPRLKG